MNATPGAGAAAGAAGGAPGESLGAGAGGMQQDTSSVLLDNLDHDVSFSGNASGAAGGVGDAASVQNLSTLLLQPIIEPRDVVHQLLHALDLYYTPGVIGVGFALNVYATFVLRNSALSRAAVTPYLSALAVTDTAYLVASLFVWLQQVHDVKVLINNGFCQLVWFTKFTTSFLSIWYLLCLQIDRYITMWHPTKAHHKTSNRHSHCITSILGILGIVLYSLLLWTSSVHKHPTREDVYVCNYITKYMDIIRIFVKADTFVTAVMPYSMLPMVNIIICLQIMIKCCSLQRYKHPAMAAVERNSRTWNNIRKTRTQVWLTASLLIVSTLIWCLNILSQWFRVRNFFKFDKNDLDLMTRRDKGHYLWYLADHLHTLSYAIKLLLYLIFSGVFRASMVECCRSYQCICSQNNDPDDVSSTCEHCACEQEEDAEPSDDDVSVALDAPLRHHGDSDDSHYSTLQPHPPHNHVTSNHVIRRDTTV